MYFQQRMKDESAMSILLYTYISEESPRPELTLLDASRWQILSQCLVYALSSVLPHFFQSGKKATHILKFVIKYEYVPRENIH